MPTYRAYHVDDEGHFHGAPQIFSVETDEDAIAHAQGLVDGYDVELWEQGGRLVTKLKKTPRLPKRSTNTIQELASNLRARRANAPPH